MAEIYRSYIVFVLLALFASFVLAGCSGNPPTGTAVPTIVSPGVVTATSTIIPTSTPTSTPTFTPLPTNTPTLTLTPTPQFLVASLTPIPDGLPVISVVNAESVSALTKFSVEDLTDLSWTPDGSSLAAGTPGRIDLYDVYTRVKWRSLFPEYDGIRQVAFSHTGQWMVSSGMAGSEASGYITYLERWLGLDMKPMGLFSSEARGLSDLEFSENGLVLFTAYASHRFVENSVEFWNTVSWENYATMKAGLVLDLSISPVGERMATSPDLYAVKVWDLNATGKPLYTILTAFTDSITTAVFSPDGLKLATAHYDGAINIFEAETGSLIRSFDAGAAVQSLAFSPDGTLLATGSSYTDHDVNIWWADSGNLLRTLEGHTAGVDVLMFSESGELLVSASYDGSIILWGVRP